jgi:hypothetical protein
MMMKVNRLIFSPKEKIIIIVHRLVENTYTEEMEEKRINH